MNRSDRIVIGGYGVVGSNPAETLAADGVPYTTIDIDSGDEIDVIGSLTDEETLGAAAVSDAHAVIPALGDDSTSIFATLVFN
ncbi:NAD-binding protein [Halalkalicoccus salilacus]|uniref:NAD-binding protein n=1 Tax=Halalkalicoccus salilacus TaxID=3117459 RepID=UPI00300F51AF